MSVEPLAPWEQGLIADTFYSTVAPAYSTSTPSSLPHLLDSLRSKTLSKVLTDLAGIAPADVMEAGSKSWPTSQAAQDILRSLVYAQSEAATLTEQDAVARLYKALGTDLGWDLSGLVPPDQTAAQLAARLAATPQLVSQRVAAGATPSEALAQSVNFITSLAGSLVHDTSRQGAANIAHIHPAFRGWVWIPEPGACSWCRMQATRGVVFHSNVRHSHRHCRCYLGEVVDQQVADSLKRIGQNEWAKMVSDGTAPHKPWPMSKLNSPLTKAGAVTPERLVAVKVQIKAYFDSLQKIDPSSPVYKHQMDKLIRLSKERDALEQALAVKASATPTRATPVRKIQSKMDPHRPYGDTDRHLHALVDDLPGAGPEESVYDVVGYTEAQRAAKARTVSAIHAEMKARPEFQSEEFARAVARISGGTRAEEEIAERFDPEKIFHRQVDPFNDGKHSDWHYDPASGIRSRLADWVREDMALHPSDWAWGGSERMIEDTVRTAVSRCIGTWAGTSADSSPLSLTMQRVAAEHFGLNLDKRIRDAIRYAEDQARHAATTTGGGVHPDKWDPTGQIAIFLDSQYTTTQRWLRDRGIDSIHLYRGMSLPSSMKAGWYEGQTKTVGFQPLSSWSLERDTAYNFGDTTFETVVPAEMVIGTPRSGFGCLGEFEFVVLADQGAATVVSM